MKLSERIKIAVLAYWKTEKHHMMGAIECKDADVFTITRTYMTTDTEVKTSIADMRREIKTKRFKHQRFKDNKSLYGLRPTSHYFYFAVPIDLQTQSLSVINERYPYAGLLVFTDGEIDVYNPHNITMVKRSQRFKHGILDVKELLELGYQSTNTAIRYIKRSIEVG
jgi:hypothetical protein